MRFGIVIPCYNEEEDIGRTLDAIGQLEGDWACLIVDDSSDETWRRVFETRCDRIFYVRPLYPDGRCGARNLGMQLLKESCDVLVILNADVLLPPDFLKKISVKYEEGADYVCVGSEVENLCDLFGRFTHYQALIDNIQSKPVNWVEWTEGFSMRSDFAFRDVLFPTGFPVPICAGEDGIFGQALRNQGAIKEVDFSIVVTHVVPSRFRDYVRMRFGRGKGCPQIYRFIYGFSLEVILVRSLTRLFLEMISAILILPAFIRTRKISTVNFQLFDFLIFPFVFSLDRLCFCVGEIMSTFEIFSVERKNRNC